MSDFRSGRVERDERDRSRREPEPTLTDTIELGFRRIVTGLVIAGGFIGIGAYLGGDEVEAPEYQVTTTADGRIIRLNTESGTVISCQGGRCAIVLRRGQDLDEPGEGEEEGADDQPPGGEAGPALPTPPPQAPRALPAPAPAPAAGGEAATTPPAPAEREKAAPPGAE